MVQQAKTMQVLYVDLAAELATNITLHPAARPASATVWLS